MSLAQDVDYQSLVRGALAAMLSLKSDLVVVAQIGWGGKVVEAARVQRPTWSRWSWTSPAWTGMSTTAAVRAAVPSCRVLIVMTFGRPGFLQRAMAAGASGFIVKDTSAVMLSDAIQRVHPGLRVIDPVLAAQTLAVGPSSLTAGETQVLARAVDGGRWPTWPSTCACRRALYAITCPQRSARPGARIRAEAVRLAEQNGWLPA